MNLTPVTSIIIPENRQRREHNIQAHQELVTSLTETAVGLQHPIVLRKEAEGFVLLAGERRLRAIRDAHALGLPLRHLGQPVPLDQVPYVLTDSLSEIDAEEAELEENVLRLDLTWAEKANATARLMKLRTAQAEARGEAPPTVRDLSLEIRDNGDGSYQEQTRRELIVAKHLDNPVVKKAKTLEEAFKVLKLQERAQRHEELAASVGSNVTLASHTCLQADAREWLAACPTNTFDVILSDPPYGMGADNFGDSGGLAAGAHGYEDNLDYWEELMTATLPHLFRVAKPSAHMYLFCDFDRFADLRSRVAASGWDVFRTPLIWYRPNGMRTPWVNKGPKRKYELILFASKGGKLVNSLEGDVLTYLSDENLGHAAQKPVALFRDLLTRSVMPGDKVLDPFCGSGPIFPAATECKCFATGVERDTASYGIAIQRLQGDKE